MVGARARGGRVYDREEMGVERMRRGFCRGKRAFREERDRGEEGSGDRRINAGNRGQTIR